MNFEFHPVGGKFMRNVDYKTKREQYWGGRNAITQTPGQIEKLPKV